MYSISLNPNFLPISGYAFFQAVYCFSISPLSPGVLSNSSTMSLDLIKSLLTLPTNCSISLFCSLFNEENLFSISILFLSNLNSLDILVKGSFGFNLCLFKASIKLLVADL
jgi:hypothetical protein